MEMYIRDKNVCFGSAWAGKTTCLVICMIINKLLVYLPPVESAKTSDTALSQLINLLFDDRCGGFMFYNCKSKRAPHANI